MKASESVLKSKTLQECADIMAQHLYNQKMLCRKGKTCVYFNKETGNKCAFGVLIPEDKYNLAFENTTVVDLETNSPGLLCSFGLPSDSKSLDFFQRAQGIHDVQWSNRNQLFESLCREFGLRYNLKQEKE